MSEGRRDERARRIELQQTITLITSDGHSLSVVLKDLSQDGFKIEHRGEYLSPWEIVTLVSNRGNQSRAQIRWITTDEAGGIFSMTSRHELTTLSPPYLDLRNIYRTLAPDSVLRKGVLRTSEGAQNG